MQIKYTDLPRLAWLMMQSFLQQMTTQPAERASNTFTR